MENCPSCGTPIDESEWRCPKCDTVMAQPATMLPSGAVVDTDVGRPPKRRLADRGEPVPRRRHPHRRGDDPPTLRERLREGFGLASGKRQHRVKVQRSTVALVVVAVAVLLIVAYALGRMAG